MRKTDECLASRPVANIVPRVVIDALHLSIDADFLYILWANNFPWCSIAVPAIRVFYLVTILEGLLKETELIEDSITYGWQVKSS